MSEARLLRSVQRLAAALAKIERHVAGEYGVSVSQLRCLQLLAKANDEGARVSDLADDQGLAVSTMTRNLALLEKKGWIVRGQGSTDGRTVRAQLTFQGQKLSDSLNEALLKTLSYAFSGFHPSDRIERAVAVGRVAEALENLGSSPKMD